MKHTEKYKQKYLVYTVKITSLQHVHIYDRKDFNVHGSVHIYLETDLHVLGGTTTHHQERKQLHLQHLVTATCRYRGR
jgi:hypothetical protein